MQHDQAPIPFFPTVKTFTLKTPDYQEPIANHQPIPADFKLHDVFIAQTHVFRPQDPYLQLVQNRGALIKLNASSISGAPAPDFTAIVHDADGYELGRILLTGDKKLPTSLDLPSQDNLASQRSHNDQDSYIAPLKEEWIKPGISITLTANGQPLDLPHYQEKTFAFRPKVGADLNLTLRIMRIAHHTGNDGVINDNIDQWGNEIVAKLPIKKLTLYSYPSVAHLNIFLLLKMDFLLFILATKTSQAVILTPIMADLKVLFQPAIIQLNIYGKLISVITK